MSKKRFFIIDDDAFNNKVCTKIIKTLFPESEVIAFTDPEIGLAYFGKEYTADSAYSNTILLLDINMPDMTGWEFLDEYEKLTDEVKKDIAIFILSSSINPVDIEKTKHYRCIDFISKPLTNSGLKAAVSLIPPAPTS